MSPRDMAFHWMDGWACGAALRGLPSDYNKHFEAGWIAAKAARKDAKREAEKYSGYQFATLQIEEPITS